MRIIITLILVIFQISLSFSQTKDTIYFDEELGNINKLTFTQKLGSSIYYAVTYNTNSTVYHELRFTHLFSKLSPIHKQQLFSILYQRNKIDTTKSILIHYQEVLKSINDFPKKIL